MDSEGLLHGGIYLCFDNTLHHIAMSELTNGRSVMIYGQTELVKDLIAARLSSDAPLLFECEDVAVDGLEADAPVVRYTHDGTARELRCDIVAGCDGFHGICRPAFPADRLSVWQREYPYAWLGDPGRRRAVDRRADLRLQRARVRPAQHALARRAAGCTSRSSLTKTSPTGRTTASGRSCTPGWPATDGR